MDSLEQLTGPGILIECEEEYVINEGEPCVLNVLAQLPDEGDTEKNTQWLRSLFLTCVSRSNQAAVVKNLLQSTVIFPQDIRKTGDDDALIQISYRMNLATELGRVLQKDGYYVQVSARQFLSNTVLVKVQ